MNEELLHIQQWFNANKLSLNTTKTKYSFFHSQAFQDRIPLQLPKLDINDIDRYRYRYIERERDIDIDRYKREKVMKFLGVILDENMTWKSHISCIESKVSKHLGVLYEARGLLDKKCLKQLYFSFVHS